MAEDVVIFVQFRLYAARDPPSIAVSWIGEWLAAVLENRLFRLGPGRLFALFFLLFFSFRYLTKKFWSSRSYGSLRCKSLLYIRDMVWCLGVFFFFALMGCTWASQREHDPGICMVIQILIQESKMQTESFCSWSHDGHGQRENWAAKLDRKRPQRGWTSPAERTKQVKNFFAFFLNISIAGILASSVSLPLSRHNPSCKQSAQSHWMSLSIVDSSFFPISVFVQGRNIGYKEIEGKRRQEIINDERKEI